MEGIITIVFIFVIVPIIYVFLEQKGKKEYKDDNIQERVGKAVGTYFHGVADEVSNMALSITESEESKQKRLQTFSIHTCVERAISGQSNYKKDELLEKFDDEQLKRYNVTAEEWKKVITKSFAIGEIVKKCVFNGKVLSNNPRMNELTYEGSKYDDGSTFRNALAYLGIPKEDWIKWGYATLAMYEVSKEIDSFLEKIK